MIKTLLLAICLSVIVSNTYAQNPIPVPGLNVHKMTGYWYLILLYSPTAQANLSCYFMVYNFTGNNIVVNQSWDSNGSHYQQTFTGTVSSQNNAIWTINDVQQVWIAADLVNYAWAVQAWKNSQYCGILSRTPTLSDTLINTQIALCKQQGYLMNANQTYRYPASGCSFPGDYEDNILYY